jgi:ribosomal protein S18 acetylase RimI-like enzyme
MNIIKASPSDLVEVLYLLRVCVLEMNSKGLVYCDLQNILAKNDIENNTVFLYKQNEVCLGMIVLDTDQDPEYKSVEWMAASHKPLVAHRLMVHPNWRNQGIAKQILTFAEHYAQENGFTSLRLDVYSENQEAVALYNNLNYKQLGEITYHYQKVPFYCFEKII